MQMSLQSSNTCAWFDVSALPIIYHLIETVTRRQTGRREDVMDGLGRTYEIRHVTT